MFAVIFYEIMQSSPTAFSQWEKAACIVLSMRPEEYPLAYQYALYPWNVNYIVHTDLVLPPLMCHHLAKHSVIIWVNLPHIQQNFRRPRKAGRTSTPINSLPTNDCKSRHELP